MALVKSKTTKFQSRKCLSIILDDNDEDYDKGDSEVFDFDAIPEISPPPNM
nr:3554_t:CDS:2 [Entrophospora candida]